MQELQKIKKAIILYAAATVIEQLLTITKYKSANEFLTSHDARES